MNRLNHLFLYTILYLSTLVFSFAQGITRPNEISGLVLWLRADSGVSLNSSIVDSLYDFSTLSNNAYQNFFNFSPTFKDSIYELNYHPVLRFDGIDDFMNFSVINNIRSAFFVTKHRTGTQDYPPLLGHSSLFDWHGGLSNLLFTGSESPFITNGFFYRNGNNVPLISEPKPINYTILSFITSGNVAAERITYDRVYERYWDGDFAEIILFNQPLDTNQRIQVEQYLHYKYAPPVNLGPDININYGFSPVTLSSSGYFTNYTWGSDISGFSSSSDSVIVNQSGYYWVDAINIFGFHSFDTINISYPYPQSLAYDSICFGDSLLFNATLSGSYSYLWSNEKTDSAIYINNSNPIWVTITDSFGNSIVTEPISLFIDTFKNTNLINADSIFFCLGNTIQVNNGISQIIQYSWSNGDDSQIIQPDSTNWYIVNAFNATGCVALDSIFVTINGVAPVSGFYSDTVCIGNYSSFFDTSSISVGSISQWLWYFSDGSSASVQNSTHMFAQSGTFNVSLVVSTIEGCSDSSSNPIIIKTKPISDFEFNTICFGFPQPFSDISIPATNISTWSWDFGDTASPSNFSNLQNPSHTFSSQGYFTVHLTVFDINGCTDDTTSSVFISNNYPIGNPILISPQYNSFIFDSIITFSWQNTTNTVSYSFVLAYDSSFSNILSYSQNIFSPTYSVTISNLSIPYFWKIIAYNFCGDSVSSESFRFNTFSPTVIEGLSLWLRSDAGIVKDTDNYISLWSDGSNLNNNAIGSGTARPILINNIPELNGKPAIAFDGNSNYLLINSPISIGSLFIILNWTGNQSTFPDHCGIITEQTLPGNIFFNAIAGTSSINSSIYDTILTNNTINSNFQPFIEYKILHATNDVPINNVNLVIGFDRMYGSRLWNGNIAEIIGFSTILNSNQIDSVFDYLHYKYAPPVNLGSDINIGYGFCDTTIHAGQRFTEFQWFKNGELLLADSLENISVNQNGIYKVTVTDIFGFTSSDSINITFPTFSQLSDTTICFGDTLSWNLNLNGHYNYSWSDNDTNAIRNITLENTYQVTITDTTSQQCSIVSQPVFINVDSFPNFVSLGPDADMCTGNTLYLQNGYNEAVTYLWNNGSINNYYTVTAQDTIFPILVTVTDSLGCIGKDTLVITGISGTAPVVGFSFNGTCFGDIMQFNDTSTSATGDTVISWNWNFGNDGSDTVTNPSHSFSQPNVFPVKLLITTNNGCSNSIIKNITVHNLPSPEFNTTNNCSNNFTNFINETISVDSITMWNWSFGDDSTSSGKNPSHSYSQEGNYDATLIATSNFGCIDSIEKTVIIKTTPITDFNYSPVCKDQPVYFADNTQTQPWNQINSWKWEFGDASLSLNINPTHTYNTIDTFIVKYITKSINGCSDTAYKILIVTMPPTASFTGLDACVNNNHQLLDASISTIPITQWKWKINSIGDFTTQNPLVVFTDTLHYNAELVVVTQTGCTDTISHTINVHRNPIANFVIIPEVAAPLQTISFDNNSSGASSYLWNFDDGQTSSYIEPTHTFADSGLYNVSLISTTTYGCNDSVFSPVRIVMPQYDIAVLDVNSTTSGNFIKVSTKIANFGSLPVDSVYLFLDMGNGVMIKEALSYHLQTGEIINYNFTSQLEITPQNTTSYICVDALPPSTITDFAPANNHYCKALVDNFEVLPPYPSPVGNHIYIEFIIPAEGNVTITLYNALGQKMKTLFNQYANAGFNRYVYLAGEISNGAYYYQVEYNGKLKTQNFIKY